MLRHSNFRPPELKSARELAMMREGVLLQLEADANEAEGTDPDTAALLRGVVAELRQARYSYDFGTRRWTLAVGELRQSVTAPGFDPNALTVVTSSMER